MAVAGGFHFRGICIEDGLVVGFMVFGKDFMKFWIDMVAVGFGGFLRHLDSAERHKSPLEWFVGLKSDDAFQIFKLRIDISRTIGGQAGYDFSFAFEHTALFVLFLLKLLKAFPEQMSGTGRGSEKAFIAIILRIVVLDEIADVHFVGPFGAQKTSPGRLKDRCVLECLIHSRHVFPSWLKNFDPSRDSESEKK